MAMCWRWCIVELLQIPWNWVCFNRNLVVFPFPRKDKENYLAKLWVCYILVCDLLCPSSHDITWYTSGTYISWHQMLHQWHIHVRHMTSHGTSVAYTSHDMSQLSCLYICSDLLIPISPGKSVQIRMSLWMQATWLQYSLYHFLLTYTCKWHFLCIMCAL